MRERATGIDLALWQAPIEWFPGGYLAQLGRERTLARFATLARSYPQGC